MEELRDRPEGDAPMAGRRDIDADTPDEGGWMRRWLPLVVLAVVAFAIPFLAAHTIFPNLSWNRDEAVYQWQVRLLRAGHFTSADGGAPAFFHPFLSAARDGKLFSQYTLGWPLVLAGADLLFGDAVVALAVGACLAVLGTYALARELTRDHRLALVSAAVMLLSPILVIQGGVYLGYLFTLGLGLFFSAALLAGIRLRSPWRLIGAGVLLGWVFMARPFDAVLWGLALLAYGGFVYRHEIPRLLRAAGWVLAGLIPLAVLTLAYNRYLTGSFLSFPITAADPLDHFGFGARRIMPTFDTANYNLPQAVKSTLRSGGFLPLFLMGTYVGVVVAIVTLWRRRRDQSSLLLLLLIAIFPLGYFFFWGIFVSAADMTLSGPIYYVPLYAPLSILIAMAIVTAWRRRRSLAVVLVAVLVIATVPIEINRIIVNHRISEQQQAYRDANAAVQGAALVFVPGTYLGFLNPFATNNATLDGRVLYAVDRGPKNFTLMAEHPERTPYIQRMSLGPEELIPHRETRSLKIAVRPVRILRGGAISISARIVNTTGARVVRAYLQVGAQLHAQTLTNHGRRGETYRTRFRVGTADAAATRPGTIALSPTGELVVGTGGARREDASTRQRFAYQVRNEQVELFLPPTREHLARVDGDLQWLPDLSVAALHVAPRAEPVAGAQP